jgi:DNA-directed RNA polymerase
MVHIANCFGVDKVSNEERVQWTKDHELQLAMSVTSPYDSSWWRDADSPWQFLASAIEWEIYKQSGEGEDFVSNLVINMDGTCNGLQHYSAMLRDEVGGKATNLIPSDTPADIYTEVLNVVRAKLEADGSTLATEWLPHLERKLVKPQVMTTPYGVSAYGMREQLSTFMREKRTKHDGSYDPILSVDTRATRQEYESFLTPLIQDAINEVVVASPRAMAWLKDCAKVTNKRGLTIRWTTPAGLPVVQAYRKTDIKRIDILVETLKVKQTRVSRLVHNETVEINTSKQLAGIAPNFVHSLDASHLMLTVNKCVDLGIKSFSMIHDSYGTTAGSVSDLQDALRSTFAEMYQGDVLNEFREDIMEQTHSWIEPVPPKGTLDINAVLDSKYFFA